MPPKGKKGNAYNQGPPRGDQKFELPNSMKEKRGGGDEWRQWSRSKLQRDQTAGAARDFHAKAFVPGPKGKDDLHQMLTTLHVANKAMEDIRQPLDNPYLDEDEKKLALEVKRYREIAADRKARDAETQASKRRIHVQLRLLSGEYRHGISTLVPTSYEELQQAFLEAFPWHLGEVAAERPDGSALHPQRCGVFEPGQVACFREVATPTEDLLTHRLQEAPAGWARETYRPGLLALSTTLAAGGACEKPNHTHTHHLHIPRHHQHHHHGDGQSSRHSSSHHKSHHSSHGSGSHAGN